MYRWLIACCLLGCGRLSFEPRTDASTGDTSTVDGDALAGDLLAHYPLTDDPSDGIVDISGNDHHAVCLTSCPILEATGYRFNGTTDVIHRPDTQTLRPTTFTVSVWIERGTSANSQALASKVFGNQLRNSWQLVIDDMNGISFCTSESMTNGVCSGTAPNTVLAATWHHVAYTHSGTEAVGYLDGAEVARHVMGIAYDTGANLFGADIDSGVFVSHFVGQMRDIRIYSRALSAAEIALLATP